MRHECLAGLVGGTMVTTSVAIGQAPVSPPASVPIVIEKAVSRDLAPQRELGWELGVQAWTFRDRTVFEAIRTAARLGLTAVELFPGQKLSPETGDVRFGPEMNAEQRAVLRKAAETVGVRLNSLGVIGITADEPAAREFFVLAKDLGMRTISCEPTAEGLDVASKLADEFAIDLAIHNHPKPSRYWHPDVVIEAGKGRSKRLGACADTGHWGRSGLDAAACLKALEGRVFELHFKDIVKDAANPDGEDRPWGTGQQNARAILAELKRQKFRGVVLAEYEAGKGAELEANVAKCVAFFDHVAAELSASARPGE